MRNGSKVAGASIFRRRGVIHAAGYKFEGWQELLWKEHLFRNITDSSIGMRRDGWKRSASHGPEWHVDPTAETKARGQIQSQNSNKMRPWQNTWLWSTLDGIPPSLGYRLPSERCPENPLQKFCHRRQPYLDKDALSTDFDTYGGSCWRLMETYIYNGLFILGWCTCIGLSGAHIAFDVSSSGVVWEQPQWRRHDLPCT